MKKLLIIVFICISINANVIYRSHLNKKDFLALNPLSYTINLSTLYDYDGYQNFINELKTDKNLFVFEYGDNKSTLMSKVLFGVFRSYNEALDAVNNLPIRLRKNKPTVNTIGKFQELYKHYHINTDVLAGFVPIRDMKKAISKQNINKNGKTINFNESIIHILKTNSIILEQNAAVQMAINEKDGAYSGFLPVVDATYDKSRVYNASDNTGSAKDKSTSKSLSASWNLFNGLEDYNFYKVKNNRYKSTLLNRQEVVDELLYEFVKAYLDFLKNQEIYKLGDENLIAYQKYVEKKKLKDKHGMLSMSKGAFVTKKHITAQINHIETNKKRYFDALFELQKYIDIDEKSNILLDFETIDINIEDITFNNIINQTIKKNAKYLQAQVEINLVKNNLDKEYKNFYPIVDLVAKRSEIDDTLVDGTQEIKKDTTIKFQTRINLYNGGKDFNEVKKLKNEQKQKIHEQESVKTKVEYNAKTALNDYKNLKEKSFYLNDLLIAANKAYTASQYDFTYAKVDEDIVLSALESLQDIKKQNIESRYDILISKYKLLYRIGIIQDNLRNIQNRKISQ